MKGVGDTGVTSSVRASASVATHPPGTRLLLGLLAIAVAVSIVHYADNYANYYAG